LTDGSIGQARRPGTARRSFVPLRTLLLFGIALLVFPDPAAAQQPPPAVSDDQVNEIAEGMYCPVCENVPLDVCGTQACHQWRELIRQKLEAGWDEEQIKAYFVSQYGARVLAAPPASGFNRLVYIVPPILLLAGALLVVWVMRAWKVRTARGPHGAESSPVLEEAYVQRLEEELEKRG